MTSLREKNKALRARNRPCNTRRSQADGWRASVDFVAREQRFTLYRFHAKIF
jgi:hypothetical protein